MSADITVSGDGTGQTSVQAQFHVDDNATDFVSLSSGDTATAMVATMTQPLAQTDVLGDITYETSFTGEDAEGTLYTVALTRTSDVSAPSSTVTMPSPFTITSPTSSSSFSRANTDIVVTYANGGTSDPMGWTITGNCITLGTGMVSNDSGTFTIPHGSLVLQGSAGAGSCQVTLTLTRQRQGQLDPHYGSGGSIVAQHTRNVAFLSTP